MQQSPECQLSCQPMHAADSSSRTAVTAGHGPGGDQQDSCLQLALEWPTANRVTVCEPPKAAWRGTKPRSSWQVGGRLSSLWALRLSLWQQSKPAL